MGDDTGSREGRISLNPLVHIDLFGTVFFPLLMLMTAPGWLFGWAKPTPVQPRNFTHYRRGQILTAAAGPASNLLLALVFSLVYSMAIRAAGSEASHPVVYLGYTGMALNVILAVFNLVPVPPLDGSWVASWGLPRHLGEAYDRIFEPYGFLILMLLFVSGSLSLILNWVAEPLISLLGALARAGAGL